MSQAPGSDPEAISALLGVPLWSYHRAPDDEEYFHLVDAVAQEPRVTHGDYVVGVSVERGAFDALVSIEPRGIYPLHLRIPEEFEVPVGDEGTLLQVAQDVAANVWRYLLASDPGLMTFLSEKTRPAFRDLMFRYGRRLSAWHIAAITKAASIASRYPHALTTPILLAVFLEEARAGKTTLAFLLSQLARERGTHDVLQILDLSVEIEKGKLKAADISVPVETYRAIEHLLYVADDLRLATDNSPLIYSRHFAAAFLMDVGMRVYLERLKIDVSRLREETFEFIVKRHGEDHREAWRAALLGTATSPPSPAPQPPRPNVFSIETVVSRDTWTTDDKLGYDLYAQAITESILKGDTEPPLTIGIQAPWGQGKTSLMRMMQERLDKGASKRDEVAKAPVSVRTAITTTYQQLIEWTKRLGANESIPAEGMLQPDAGTIPTIWFNPLYYRDTSQVWAGMAHAILHQLVERLGVGGRELFWFRLQQARINTAAIRSEIHNRILQRFLPIGLGLAALTVLAATSLAFIPSASALASVGTLLGGAGITGFAYRIFKGIVEQKEIDANFDKYVTEPNYRTELGLLHLIDHDLDRALGLLVGKRPIAVFIDDLDRCDPGTVNQVILAINQFLSLPRRNVFFFLGMDMEMVANALEAAQKEIGGATGGTYRRSFGWRFMEKFVQLPFVIPHLEREHAQEFAEAYLRGNRPSARPPAPQELLQKVADAPTPSALGAVVAELPPDTAPEVRSAVQQAASTRAADLMKDSDSEEMKAIAKMAVEDLELNPRTIVRYFCLVRVLRNIQVSCGNTTDDDTDRKLVLRAAHLLMNWPQFVQWLRNEPETLMQDGAWKETVGEIETLAANAKTLAAWSEGVTRIARAEKVPAWLADPLLYRYLCKLAGGGPGLQTMYDKRIF